MSLDVAVQSQLDSMTIAPVSQDVVSEEKAEPHVWFQRRTTNQDLLNNGSLAIGEAMYDVEVAGLDIDATNLVADELQLIHGYRGVLGTTQPCAFAHGVWVEDVGDEYIPRSVSDDTGMHVVAFRLRILH